VVVVGSNPATPTKHKETARVAVFLCLVFVHQIGAALRNWPGTVSPSEWAIHGPVPLLSCSYSLRNSTRPVAQSYVQSPTLAHQVVERFGTATRMTLRGPGPGYQSAQQIDIEVLLLLDLFHVRPPFDYAHTFN
jgi:hypothetical protein